MEDIMVFHGAISHPRRNTRGLAFAFSGLIFTLAFAAFLFLVPQGHEVSRSPLWIPVIWGVMVIVYGCYRLIRGDSDLDHERGGTHADSR
ncbi:MULTISPECIES: hypothetical protein [Glutamicibacter]|jgi:hypothetical protein|nr:MULTISPECIES: hypothetical protein [Glutamicibacter]TLK51147.1 hypothetical protein FDN03_12130 [Glutamicibacter sp. V16R2B1]